MAQAERLAPAIRNWYETARPASSGGGPVAPEIEGLEPLLVQAMRPFLSRCADAIMARTNFAGWRHGNCPLCGGEPDFAIITPAAERLLICARCTTRWRFSQLACPFCLNEDRTRITSFATRDGLYRLSACDVCQRYIKAFDGRSAHRPAMPAVDAIATLPLARWFGIGHYAPVEARIGVGLGGISAEPDLDDMDDEPAAGYAQ